MIRFKDILLLQIIDLDYIYILNENNTNKHVNYIICTLIYHLIECVSLNY